MNLADLLHLGITASLDDDGGLLLDAPKGALTHALIERIRQYKPVLIAEIRGEPAPTPARASVHNETAVRAAPGTKTFVVALPGRKPFGVSCPQGEEAVRAQWPTAASVQPV